MGRTQQGRRADRIPRDLPNEERHHPQRSDHAQHDRERGGGGVVTEAGGAQHAGGEHRGGEGEDSGEQVGEEQKPRVAEYPARTRRRGRRPGPALGKAHESVWPRRTTGTDRIRMVRSRERERART